LAKGVKMPKKVYTGKVLSNKMDKTVVVGVSRVFKHPLYKKTVKSMSKFKAHDEGNICKIGDQVQIIESRPISRDKRWQVVKILSGGG